MDDSTSRAYSTRQKKGFQNRSVSFCETVINVRFIHHFGQSCRFVPFLDIFGFVSFRFVLFCADYIKRFSRGSRYICMKRDAIF